MAIGHYLAGIERGTTINLIFCCFKPFSLRERQRQQSGPRQKRGNKLSSLSGLLIAFAKKIVKIGGFRIFYAAFLIK
jgi:hypothetical protein